MRGRSRTGGGGRGGAESDLLAGALTGGVGAAGPAASDQPSGRLEGG